MPSRREAALRLGASLDANRCRLHDRLEAEGFAGCARHDCGGAGPRVVTELFPGRSWRDGPAAARRHVRRVSRALRALDELRAMLATTRRLALGPRYARTVASLASALAPPGGWSLAALERLETGPLPSRIRAYLRSLRWQVPRPDLTRGPAALSGPSL